MQNGLYNIRLDSGGRSVNGGVVLMREGSILGGDAFFYYVGTYSAADGQWSGELVAKQHTRSTEAVPAFGAVDVKVGLSGGYGNGCIEGLAVVNLDGSNKDLRLTLRLIADV